MENTLEPSIIQVTNPTPFKQNGKGIIVYTVEGDFIKFPLIRSLNDFRLFRNKLRINWPGIIIPYLDEALQDNKDESVSINKFIKLLYQLKEIYVSDDFHLFFSLTPNITDALNSSPNKTLEDIGDKYEKLYRNITENDFDIDSQYTIINQYIVKYRTLYNGLKELGLSLAYKLYNQKEEITSISNSYIELLCFSKEEKNKVFEILDALVSLEPLYHQYLDMKSRVTVIGERMKEMVNNNKTVMLFLKMKSPEEEFNELLSEKLVNEVDMNNIYRIIKYSFFRVENYIKQFNDSNKEEYYEKLKNSIKGNNKEKKEEVPKKDI